MSDLIPILEDFAGAAGNKLVGDRYGSGKRAAILLHGGGQTRHAFAGTAAALAATGLDCHHHRPTRARRLGVGC